MFRESTEESRPPSVLSSDFPGSTSNPHTYYCSNTLGHISPGLMVKMEKPFSRIVCKHSVEPQGDRLDNNLTRPIGCSELIVLGLNYDVNYGWGYRLATTIFCMDHLIQCAFPTPDRGPLTISVLSTAGDDVDVVKITTERSPPAYRIGLIKVYQGAVVQVLNLHSRSMIALPPRERDTCEEQKAPEEPPKGGIAIKHGEMQLWTSACYIVTPAPAGHLSEEKTVLARISHNIRGTHLNLLEVEQCVRRAIVVEIQ
ncbi:hypothetical protein EDD15DRAFT_2192580 [Pisolithus albus]|nr:hypothetical protein EDD15DRAFT_2192580 [Pisolithus albus]